MKERKKIWYLLLVFLMIWGINIGHVMGEEIELKSFELKTKELYQEEKMYFDIEYTGDVTFIAIWAKEETTNQVFYISTNKLEEDYFDLAEKKGSLSNTPGSYQLTGVTLGKQGGVVYYSTSGCKEESSDCHTQDFSDVKFKIKEKKQEVVEDEIGIFDYVLNIEFQQVHPGDKVKVGFSSPASFNGKEINEKPVSNVMLSFKGDNNEILNVYLTSLDNNPYFIVPSTANPGTYTIIYGYLTFTDGTSEKYQNRVGKVFSYESRFEIKEKELDKTKYTFNSEDYDNTVVENLEKLNKDAVITINANNSPIIFKEIFEILESSEKTLIIDYQNLRWVFNGKDIVDPKTIEVSVKFEEILENQIELLDDDARQSAVLLDFTNNGNLPGKTLIKLDSKEIDKYFESEVLYVYYYDEESGKLSKVAMEVQKNKGFFEFYINHNSKYVLTAEEIKEEKTKEIEEDSILEENNNAEEKKAEDKNVKNNTSLYICIVAIIVLLIIICVILVKNKNNGKEVVKKEE